MHKKGIIHTDFKLGMCACAFAWFSALYINVGALLYQCMLLTSPLYWALAAQVIHMDFCALATARTINISCYKANTWI